MSSRHRNESGFSLFELMVTVAIIAIITAIAIPLYVGYIDEAKFAKMRSGIDTMRVFLEDYRLDNNEYVDAQWIANGPPAGQTLSTLYNWVPDGDTQTDYIVTAIDGGNSFDVLAREAFGGTAWVLCEDRMNNCCYSDPNAPAAPPAACP